VILSNADIAIFWYLLNSLSLYAIFLALSFSSVSSTHSLFDCIFSNYVSSISLTSSPTASPITSYISLWHILNFFSISNYVTLDLMKSSVSFSLSDCVYSAPSLFLSHLLNSFSLFGYISFSVSYSLIVCPLSSDPKGSSVSLFLFGYVFLACSLSDLSSTLSLFPQLFDFGNKEKDDSSQSTMCKVQATLTLAFSYFLFLFRSFFSFSCSNCLSKSSIISPDKKR